MTLQELIAPYKDHIKDFTEDEKSDFVKHVEMFKSETSGIVEAMKVRQFFNRMTRKYKVNAPILKTKK